MKPKVQLRKTEPALSHIRVDDEVEICVNKPLKMEHVSLLPPEGQLTPPYIKKEKTSPPNFPSISGVSFSTPQTPFYSPPTSPANSRYVNRGKSSFTPIADARSVCPKITDSKMTLTKLQEHAANCSDCSAAVINDNFSFKAELLADPNYTCINKKLNSALSPALVPEKADSANEKKTLSDCSAEQVSSCYDDNVVKNIKVDRDAYPEKIQCNARRGPPPYAPSERINYGSLHGLPNLKTNEDSPDTRKCFADLYKLGNMPRVKTKTQMREIKPETFRHRNPPTYKRGCREIDQLYKSLQEISWANDRDFTNLLYSKGSVRHSGRISSAKTVTADRSKKLAKLNQKNPDSIKVKKAKSSKPSTMRRTLRSVSKPKSNVSPFAKKKVQKTRRALRKRSAPRKAVPPKAKRMNTRPRAMPVVKIKKEKPEPGQSKTKKKLSARPKKIGFVKVKQEKPEPGHSKIKKKTNARQKGISFVKVKKEKPEPTESKSTKKLSSCSSVRVKKEKPETDLPVTAEKLDIQPSGITLVKVKEEPLELDDLIHAMTMENMETMQANVSATPIKKEIPEPAPINFRKRKIAPPVTAHTSEEKILASVPINSRKRKTQSSVAANLRKGKIQPSVDTLSSEGKNLASMPNNSRKRKFSSSGIARSNERKMLESSAINSRKRKIPKSVSTNSRKGKIQASVAAITRKRSIPTPVAANSSRGKILASATPVTRKRNISASVAANSNKGKIQASLATINRKKNIPASVAVNSSKIKVPASVTATSSKRKNPASVSTNSSKVRKKKIAKKKGNVPKLKIKVEKDVATCSTKSKTDFQGMLQDILKEAQESNKIASSVQNKQELTMTLPPVQKTDICNTNCENAATGPNGCELYTRTTLQERMLRVFSGVDQRNISSVLREAHDSRVAPGSSKGSRRRRYEEEGLRCSVRQSECAFRYKEIVVKKHEQYIQVVLVPNTYKQNCLTVEAMKELKEALQSARRDSNCKAVLLNSSGSFFCSGIDMRQLCGTSKKHSAEEMAVTIRDLILTFAIFPKPVVAAVNGCTVGLGVSLLTFCDIVFASDKATFSIPSAQFGYIPEGGVTLTLPQVVGSTVAMDMLLHGRRLTAEQAMKHGLVSEVLWPSKLMEEVAPRMQSLVQQPLQVMEATKTMVRCHLWEKLAVQLNHEWRLLPCQWLSTVCQQKMKAHLQNGWQVY